MSSGSVANRYDYSPFGQLIADVETVENPFKFSSEYAEKETGLIYYNYRYYNPKDGKWLSRDPIEEKGGINVYGFVDNDTIKNIDSLGLKKVESDLEFYVEDSWETFKYGNKDGYNGTNGANLASSIKNVKISCDKSCGEKGSNPKKIGNGKNLELYTLIDKGIEVKYVTESSTWFKITTVKAYRLTIKYRRYKVENYKSEEWDCNCCDKGFLSWNKPKVLLVGQKRFEFTAKIYFVKNKELITTLKMRKIEWDEIKKDVLKKLIGVATKKVL
ncbi:RHS repeat-associated core domain-containing protein [Lentisphaerota bacterium WC36G]|nr:RHS repeat-associated core domain-containing protein [Lentisphaerae bacterium WC36]